MDRIQVAAGGLRAQRSSASTRFSHDRAQYIPALACMMEMQPLFGWITQ